MRIAIGIDIGGTKLAGAAVDERGQILARKELPSSARNDVTIVSGVAKLVDELKAIAPRVKGVGIGCAGLIDDRSGVVVTSPNLPLRDIGLRDMLSTRVGLPVILENDANVAAVGEALVGAGAGRSPVLCVTVGTGIGGGIVVDGRLLRGANGFAGEVGHMVVDPDGPVCACGSKGCLEAMASGNALGRVALERIEDPAAVALRERRDAGAKVTGALVGALAADGDPFAGSIIIEAGRWLGLGLANLANLLDPEVIVVGGGAGSGTADLLLPSAVGALSERLLGHGFRLAPEVVPAALGNAAGVTGAALLVLGQAADQGGLNLRVKGT
ncbi:MAG: ROK family protein [Actinomycetota bacterium]